MQHPAKWRATADPFALPYRSFEPVEVLGCPHAGNDVFQMRGLYRGRLVEAYVKVARRSGAGVCNELAVLAALEAHDAAAARACMAEHLARYKVEAAAMRAHYPDYFKQK